MRCKLLILLLFPLLALADAVDSWTKSYDQILKTYVTEGEKQGIKTTLVNYKGLRSDPAFKKLLRELEKLPSFSTAPREKQLAMWLNAYNCLILKIGASHLHIHSLNQLNGQHTSIWKKKIGVVAKKKYSPDDIEHGILRKCFDDPRIHFAISCGTLSSPDLPSYAYSADLLNTQLNERMERFLSNPTKGMRIPDEEIELSPIFRWYQTDFRPDPKDWLIDKGLLSEDSSSFPISYLEYNWFLNSR